MIPTRIHENDEPTPLARSASLLTSSKHPSVANSWQALSAREGPANNTATASGAERTMRKRHSFFARAYTDTTTSVKRVPSSHAPTTRDGERDAEAPSRPGTALSMSSRRRKTEPLESLRNSIFGGRKKSSSREMSSTPGSRPRSRETSDTSPEARYQSEQEYYRHLRKASISPPFNFEHVTHTARTQLPPLETVDERDLKAEFWAASAYQRPRRHLTGIKAENLSSKLPAIGVQRGAPSSRPTSPGAVELPGDGPLVRSLPVVSSINETIFDEINDTKFEPDAAMERLHLKSQSSRQARRYSSMSALNEQKYAPGHSVQSLGTFYEANENSPPSQNAIQGQRGRYGLRSPPPVTYYDASDSSPSPRRVIQQHRSRSPRTYFETNDSSESDAPSDKTLPYRSRISPETPSKSFSPPADASSLSPSGVSTVEAEPVSPATSPRTDFHGICDGLQDLSEPYHYVDRSKLPLPPLPQAQVSEQASLSSLNISDLSSSSCLSISSSDRPSSVKSKRSSQSAHKSPAESNTSTASDARRPSILSDATWEDDVDFCYELNAESTCQFDWNTTPQSIRDPSIAESEGGEGRLTTWLAPSPIPGSESPFSSLAPPTEDRAIVHTRRESPSQHSRGSSVGHRGFLAARRGSKNGPRGGSADRALKVKNTPPPIGISPSPGPLNILSPVLSVSGDHPEPIKSPFPPGTLPFHGFNGANRGSAEYLSDQESTSTGYTKHSKSSSYGSYESVSRPGASNAGREAARWSVASVSSVPELIPSKRKSKAFVHKGLISKPLESLPQSPGDQESFTEGSTIVPRAAQIEPMRNTFIMRRPESVSDRAVLQAAGRAVQRGRPTTPTLSRLLGDEYRPQRASSAQPPRPQGWI